MGNICRSPAAEGTFRHLVQSRQLENLFHIDSAGTHAYHVGESPNPRTIRTAMDYGITLQHCARKFSQKDFEEFDYILPMDQENLENVLSLARNQTDRKKVIKYRTFDPDLNAGNIPDVPDPYYGQIDGFREVQEILIRSSEKLLGWLQERGI